MYLDINLCLSVRCKFVLEYLMISDPKQLANHFYISISVNNLYCVSAIQSLH